MLNVQELERRWLRYKIKHYMPYIFIFIVVIILLILSYIYLIDKSSTDTHVVVQKPKHLESVSIAKDEKKVTENIVKHNTIKKSVKTTTIQNRPPERKKIVITPSLKFIETLKYMPKEEIKVISVKEKKQSVNTEKPKDIQVVDHKDIPQIEYSNKKRSALTTNTVEQKKEKVNAGFSINLKEEAADIQDVIERFKNNKNPALSLFVAKRFYAIKKYRDAYNYALTTNELNSAIEDSWIIAAKSLYKLDKKDEAIRLLNGFIEESQSIRAKIILEQIKNGSL